LKEFRPGLKANEEFGVVSPLRCFKKSEIRFMARTLGLPNWDKPTNSCLATRILEDIERYKIEMVERAEDFLLNRGFRFVRVRFRDTSAFVEVGFDEVDRFFALRHEIVKKLKSIGFKRVFLDLEGRSV